MMKLITAHRILITAAVAMGAILVGWGVVYRQQPGSHVVLGLGAVILTVGGLYLRKLWTRPPIQ